MRLVSTRSVKDSILEDLILCRERTLDLWERIDPDLFNPQAHPDFSPIGWHFGHIAYTESYWILERFVGLPALYPQYHKIFAADGLPKYLRSNLPELPTLRDYLHTVRDGVINYLTDLDKDTIVRQERLWRWLIQHESQHNETICILWQLHRPTPPRVYPVKPPEPTMLAIPGGKFILGSDDIIAQDNERSSHLQNLNTFYIDKYPVTCIEYKKFMEADGYKRREFWSEAGWRWLRENPVSRPLYWFDRSEYDYHPVHGVSAHEAEAYAKFIGKRLPTEAEWEKAAGRAHNPTCNHDLRCGGTTPVNLHDDNLSPYGCADMSGNVWEWTASVFQPYPDFKPYPYTGYSQVYFDNEHRVLRGGSWVTRSWGLRTTFRNWYHPSTREIFAGFRCVIS